MWKIGVTSQLAKLGEEVKMEKIIGFGVVMEMSTVNIHIIYLVESMVVMGTLLALHPNFCLNGVEGNIAAGI